VQPKQKALQPTAPLRYTFNGDAAAREYWSIKPLPRKDRKIIAMY
jgi:hypothetical protein